MCPAFPYGNVANYFKLVDHPYNSSTTWRQSWCGPKANELIWHDSLIWETKQESIFSYILLPESNLWLLKGCFYWLLLTDKLYLSLSIYFTVNKIATKIYYPQKRKPAITFILPSFMTFLPGTHLYMANFVTLTSLVTLCQPPYVSFN